MVTIIGFKWFSTTQGNMRSKPNKENKNSYHARQCVYVDNIINFEYIVALVAIAAIYGYAGYYSYM